MAKFRWSLFCCVLNIGINLTAGSIHLDVRPTDIQMDLTGTVTANCSFSYDTTSNIANLISLRISKNDTVNGTSQELVSLDVFDPDNASVKPKAHINATATGHIETSGPSTLTLHWTNPTAADAGVYLCTAHGLDTSGQPVDLSDTAQVTAHCPDIGQVVESAKTLQLDVDDLQITRVFVEDKITHMITSLDTLVTRIAFLETQIKDLTQSGTEIRDNIFRLEEYTSAQLFYQRSTFRKSSDYNGSFYLLSNTNNIDTSVSEADCVLVGGHLAEIGDAGENEFIKSFINSTLADDDDSKYVLVGGIDTGHEGQWLWQHSQLPFDYSDWTPGNPYQSNSYNCLFLYKNSSWSWYDEACTLNKPFLCEISEEP